MAACGVGLLLTPVHCAPPPSGSQPAGTGEPSAEKALAPGTPQFARRNETLTWAWVAMVLSGLASKMLVGPLDPAFALSARAWHCAAVVSVTAANRFMSVMIFAAFIGSCTPILVQSSFTPVHAGRTVVEPTPHDAG